MWRRLHPISRVYSKSLKPRANISILIGDSYCARWGGGAVVKRSDGDDDGDGGPKSIVVVVVVDEGRVRGGADGLLPTVVTVAGELAELTRS